MSISDREYVNFLQDDELNYILKKYNKKQSQENRTKLKKIGQACKDKLNVKMLKHTDFYPHLKQKLNELD